MAPFSSNFDFLKQHDELLFQLALTAEKSFSPDPNTTLVKLRQLGEALAQEIAARIGVEVDSRTRQLDLLRSIDYKLQFDRNVSEAFHQIRKLGNQASHDFSSSTHKDALKSLQISWALCGWFHSTFGGVKAKGFKLGSFVKPQDPSAEVRELEERIRIFEAEQERTSERLKMAESLKEAQQERVEAERKRADEMEQERAIWEEIAQDHEVALSDLRDQFYAANQEKSEEFLQLSNEKQDKYIHAVEDSKLVLSEAETRVLIDQQLVETGWEADTDNLRYSKGGRPEHNKCKAIAEWPTSSGPADYILFDGLNPVATVEAKKKNKDVYAAIDQAKRYARDFEAKGVCEPIAPGWGEYKVPLVFSANGRPYLKQLEWKSGIWFNDVRNPTHRRRALQSWYTPQGVRAYLKQNIVKAEGKLDTLGFDYGFTLRPYQKEAIHSVERAIKDGQQTCLLAMATGTGKTKTSIALVYRLLRTERFRRVLFLVDRTALGDQATNAFNETRMENLQTFADCFGIKDLDEKTPDDDTKVQIATIQGMVKRILYGDDSDNRPSVDQYDCIVVDECHRGYLLDRMLSDTEIEFRDQADYVSKYRRAIEYFDAVKVGLTATPAIHTVDIFGEPVYTYSYPEAVIDGFLVDHLPPIRIKTMLSEEGIHYKTGEEVQLFQAQTGQLDLVHAPDNLDFDIGEFNRKVLSENFNREVCKALVQRIDPWLPEKTLIFCATDEHADTVVDLLKQEYEAHMGEIEDDAILKITGTSDKPLKQIRRYRNDRLPNIAVTVDLLTTGIDVPEICNLVFIRRVNSRILYEQMLGRATRLCPEIGKENFRIYDAVNLYDSLQDVNTMKPIVTNPNIGFTALIEELRQESSPDLQKLAKDQFMAKLNSKRRHMSEEKLDAFEAIAGMPPEAFVQKLKQMDLQTVAEWFTNNPDLGEILDAKGASNAPPVVVSGHEDELLAVETGYGANQKPEDYLNAFKKFILENSNRLPALQIVIQRPWELTRRSLKELAIELERHHFREQDLKIAWYELKNEDIAARIIGFIRQAAIGEALVPWDQRVDRALQAILALQDWKQPQKHWLQAIAKQMKATTIVDRQALDEGIIKHQMGGLKRANRLFGGEAGQVLDQFNHALWDSLKATK